MYFIYHQCTYHSITHCLSKPPNKCEFYCTKFLCFSMGIMSFKTSKQQLKLFPSWQEILKKKFELSKIVLESLKSIYINEQSQTLQFYNNQHSEWSQEGSPGRYLNNIKSWRQALSFAQCFYSQAVVKMLDGFHLSHIGNHNIIVHLAANVESPPNTFFAIIAIRC